MATPPKVPVYSLPELKSTTDDAIAPYLTSLPKPYTFTANNTKSNVRLALGYSAVAIAAVSFWQDYTRGWEATRPWIFSAVVAYFVLNFVLTIWILLVEAGQVFEGTTEKGEKVRLCSSSKKHSPVYTLRITHTSPTGKVLQEKIIESSFARWFSSDGTFQQDAFRLWLSSELGPVVPSSTHGDSRKESK
ncbi:hypothetical protein VTO42DRAFT_794 [Malbranchea cinnamomea]